MTTMCNVCGHKIQLQSKKIDDLPHVAFVIAECERCHLFIQLVPVPSQSIVPAMKPDAMVAYS